MKTLFARFAAAGLCLGLSLTSLATPVSFSFDYSGVPVPIPDGSLGGITLVGNVDASFDTITSLVVSLDIAGRNGYSGWNGDLYASLYHAGELVVLLNRPGVTATDDLGYSDSGMRVTFSDSAPNNIRDYRACLPSGNSTRLAGVLGGVWQPDGRVIDPEEVSNPPGSYEVTSLAAFKGLEPDGPWTLFLADADYAGLSQLNGWSLTFDVPVAIPDAATTWLLLLTGLALIALFAVGVNPLTRLRQARAHRQAEPTNDPRAAQGPR